MQPDHTVGGGVIATAGKMLRTLRDKELEQKKRRRIEVAWTEGIEVSSTEGCGRNDGPG
jgi:hypothetical protein